MTNKPLPAAKVKELEAYAAKWADDAYDLMLKTKDDKVKYQWCSAFYECSRNFQTKLQSLINEAQDE